MIRLEKTSVCGLEPAIRGMRNPLNSWDKSDSMMCDAFPSCEECHLGFDACEEQWGKIEHEYNPYVLGPNDYELALRLARAGSDHAKYRRMIVVYVDITAPLYWWKEFDTYKVGTVANSCSTMHTIAEKEFTLKDFSIDHLYLESEETLQEIVDALNDYRTLYLQDKEKNDWWQLIQMLPSSYNQKRTVMMNYEVLADIYSARRTHKLDEWKQFCQWIEKLPYHELITVSCSLKEEKTTKEEKTDSSDNPYTVWLTFH